MPFFICHCHSASSQRLSLHLLFFFFFFHPPSPSCRRSSNSPGSPLFAFHLLLSAACSSFSHISRPLPEPQSSANVPAPCHNALSFRNVWTDPPPPFLVFRVQTWLEHTQKLYRRGWLVAIRFVSLSRPRTLSFRSIFETLAAACFACAPVSPEICGKGSRYVLFSQTVYLTVTRCVPFCNKNTLLKCRGVCHPHYCHLILPPIASCLLYISDSWSCEGNWNVTKNVLG